MKYNAAVNTPLALSIISDHHELLDGSGYPRGLNKADLSMYVRVVTVCDIYQNLLSKKNKNPFEALTILKNDYADKIDVSLLNPFIALCGPKDKVFDNIRNEFSDI